MAITDLSVLPVGTRVRIQRSTIPSNPGLIGRPGTVVEHSMYFPNNVGVVLDGEPEIRTFAPAELEILEGPEAIPPDRDAARKRLSRP